MVDSTMKNNPKNKEIHQKKNTYKFSKPEKGPRRRSEKEKENRPLGSPTTDILGRDVAVTHQGGLS